MANEADTGSVSASFSGVRIDTSKAGARGSHLAIRLAQSHAAAASQAADGSKRIGRGLSHGKLVRIEASTEMIATLRASSICADTPGADAGSYSLGGSAPGSPR